NGVDPFWISNRVANRKQPIFLKKGIVNILYIGKFNRGKNVANLIAAVEKLNKQNLGCNLTLVGGGGNNEKNILKLVEIKSFVDYLGTEYDLDRLKVIFRNSDIFAMP